ncbi:hypothetical protein AABB24_010914 [Solanum stoloniferum]|uniref:UspA domain-containing protein n=5 Tax=Solanum TaxID=4107 RepID=A0ABQ7UHE8_SOLTU|nr:PREDICTED: uncharacterized protein LOC102593440 [Solanum tuberosum]XP_049373109.1 uncharacterized protein LOC125838096 [Solanum verrucosum]XP_049412035.1 uncharacterized protein LOC125875024 [Solanum stenotomum]KAH0658730.1 hypothetical protein KY289_027478 [Solanum tuberosum]KAH0662313.1 hypothetical protein KY284_027244 [Solanum tuberosum]KAH0666066.1 hypothetical protein KY285_027272 [Solanum tuberosum]KAH0749039.1 hypothetical protein KY290_028271 [Solanum tuberosum]WMV34482.1 hypothe
MTMSSSSFMRQLSGKEGWKSTSKRWGGGGGGNWKQMEAGFNNMCGGGNGYNGGLVMRKRVMVVVDQSSHTKHAMMWALTHVTNKGDILTLLHIVPHSSSSSSSHCANNKGFSSDSSSSSAAHLASSLGSLCKACKPEVEVEALVIQGPKMATVMSQVKKLEVSVLVLGQKKPSSLFSCLCGRSSEEEFVEQCINTLDCLTIGVRKQSQGMGGYLISTRWQKNFWLLA